MTKTNQTHYNTNKIVPRSYQNHYNIYTGLYTNLYSKRDLLLNHDQQHSHTSFFNNSYPRGYEHLMNNTSSPESGSSDTSMNASRDHYTPYKIPMKRHTLSSVSSDILESWYYENESHPYPDAEQIEHLAETTQMSMIKVRKWMANKRVRCSNTLSFNGSIHPKRLHRLQREQRFIHKFSI